MRRRDQGSVDICSNSTVKQHEIYSREFGEKKEESCSGNGARKSPTPLLGPVAEGARERIQPPLELGGEEAVSSERGSFPEELMVKELFIENKS